MKEQTAGMTGRGRRETEREREREYIAVACTRTFHPSQIENYIKRRMEVKINQKARAI